MTIPEVLANPNTHLNDFIILKLNLNDLIILKLNLLMSPSNSWSKVCSRLRFWRHADLKQHRHY